RAALCLAGNHDLGVLGEIGLEEFAGDAVVAARWTRGVLAEGSRAFLQSLRPEGERDGVELFHGSPRDPVWEYLLTEPAVRTALEMTTAKLVLVGHSHIPIALRLSDGDELAGGLAKGGSEIDLDEGRWLLNPGSVGQPRDTDPRAAYLLIDLETKKAHFRRVPYDIAATQAEIREAGLPETLAERLEVG